MAGFLFTWIFAFLFFQHQSVFSAEVCMNPHQIKMPDRNILYGEFWNVPTDFDWKTKENAKCKNRTIPIYHRENTSEDIKEMTEIATVVEKASFLLQMIIDSAIELGEEICFDSTRTTLESKMDVYQSVSLSKSRKKITLNPKNLYWTKSGYAGVTTGARALGLDLCRLRITW